MTRDDLLAFVRAHRWAIVSSVSPDGEPQGSIVRIVATDAFELVFDTTDTTRKTANLRANSRVGLVIGWDDNQTIQIQGVAHEPSGTELQHLKQLYSDRYPDYCRTRQLMKGLVYFLVRPKWMRYSDFRQNPATVVTVDLVTKDKRISLFPFRVDLE